MNIYLLRHGETDWNHEKRIQGRTDIGMNDRGRMQIRHAADVLASLPAEIEVILSSPLSRARESARIVADRLGYRREDIVVEPLLIERSFGEGEGLTEQERRAKYPDSPFGHLYPGMESVEELLGRARKAFDKITETYCDKENVLAVCHGAILFAIMSAATDGGIVYWGDQITLQQGNIHRLIYDGGAVRAAQYSEEDPVFREVQLEKGRN